VTDFDSARRLEFSLRAFARNQLIVSRKVAEENSKPQSKLTHYLIVVQGEEIYVDGK
jgi:hypothetical protein